MYLNEVEDFAEQLGFKWLTLTWDVFKWNY